MGRRLTQEQAKPPPNVRFDMRPQRLPGRTLAGAIHYQEYQDATSSPMMPTPPDLSPIRPPMRPRTLRVGLARGRRPR